MVLCIYCKRDENSALFKGVEHVIPQAFGTFSTDTPTLNCVCDDCNGQFGRTLDTYLARETIEGVTRYKKGIFSGEARPQKHLEITLESGPETGRFAGMKVAIDGTTGELMPPVAQFQILNQKTGKTETYFRKQITDLRLPENIYGKPGDGSGNGTWKCTIIAPTKDEHDEIVGMLNANGIAFIPGSGFHLGDYFQGDGDDRGKTFPVAIQGEVTDTHRRAHAKIFMNFVAHYLGVDEALKPHWDFLRDFVRNATGVIKYKMIEEPFAGYKDSEALRMIQNSISVRIENARGHVVGTIQFYGNQLYQYILRESASLPAEHVTGYLFMHGEAPRMLFQRALPSVEEQLTASQRSDEPRLVFDRTPVDISAHIKQFCRSIAPEAKPVIVPVVPDAIAAERDCFYAVAERVKRDGGEIIFGWNIWTWPHVWVKAEHHAVWREPGGNLVDITPKANGAERILFIADPAKPYDYENNRRLMNICKALKPDPLIEAVFTAERELFEFEEANTVPGTLVVNGDADQYHGLLLVKEYQLAVLAQKYLRGSQPCPCRSGNKVRDCHGPDFQQMIAAVEAMA